LDEKTGTVLEGKKEGRSLDEKTGMVLEGKNWDGPEKRKKHQKNKPAE